MKDATPNFCFSQRADGVLPATLRCARRVAERQRWAQSETLYPDVFSGGVKRRIGF